jgi:hypothetical protein
MSGAIFNLAPRYACTLRALSWKVARRWPGSQPLFECNLRGPLVEGPVVTRPTRITARSFHGTVRLLEVGTKMSKMLKGVKDDGLRARAFLEQSLGTPFSLSTSI